MAGLPSVLCQAGGNFLNTFYDRKLDKAAKERGIDGDEGIVMGHVSPQLCLTLGFLCAFLGYLSHFVLYGFASLHWYTMGWCLSVFYTCPPLQFKHRAMGDFTVLVAFGLLLPCYQMDASAEIDLHCLLVLLPATLLTIAILHANNLRDIKIDREFNVRTLANILSEEDAQFYYCYLTFASYFLYGALAIYQTKSRDFTLASLLPYALPFLTMPIASSNFKRVKGGKYVLLDQDTAKLHLLVGLASALGMLLSNTY